MRCFPRYRLLCIAALTMTMLAISVSHRLGYPQDGLRSLDDWDVLDLAVYLNRAGLEVQICSSRQDGLLPRNAYLTTCPKNWSELNRLRKGPEPVHIRKWQGVVYCERVGRGEPGIHLWENHYLAIGPFWFYGDAELLERIRAILTPSAI